jgi:deazaflavin-dependent oxidoreductase (nitroreductase family)
VENQLPRSIAPSVDARDGRVVRLLTGTLSVGPVHDRGDVVAQRDDVGIVDRESLPRIGLGDAREYVFASRDTPSGKDMNRVRGQVLGVGVAVACGAPEGFFDCKQLAINVHGCCLPRGARSVAPMFVLKQVGMAFLARTRHAPGVNSRALRWLFGLPVWLYRLHAGWLLGHRFLLLTHVGRRTGSAYCTVLEVLEWHSVSGEAVVVSGFGTRAQWYRNVLAGGAAEVQIARSRFRARARLLDIDEAKQVLLRYERRNRIVGALARLLLSRLVGFPYDGSAAARRRALEVLPMLAFAPRIDDTSSDRPPQPAARPEA